MLQCFYNSSKFVVTYRLTLRGFTLGKSSQDVACRRERSEASKNYNKWHRMVDKNYNSVVVVKNGVVLVINPPPPKICDHQPIRHYRKIS